MYNILFKLGRASSVVLAVTFLLTSHSAAQGQTPSESSPTESSNSEVRRTDWSYQTLQQLATKYECLPQDSAIFTSNRRVISRQVFATNLTNCLQSIEELVARRPRKPTIRKKPATPEVIPATPEVTTPPPAPIQPAEPVPPAAPIQPAEPVEPEVSQQDLDNIKQLVASFDSEIAALEKRITSKSFSTTTKLVGEIILSLSGYGGARSTTTADSSNTIFTNRVRLNFDTSFSGKDRLRTRLQSRNTTQFNAISTDPNRTTVASVTTNQARLGYDGASTEANDTLLSLLQYDFPLSPETKVRIATFGYEFNDNQPTLNPLLSSSANGAISRFGRFNPIFRQSGDGAAVNIAHKFSDELSLDLGYAVPGSIAAGIAPSNGFFKGSNALLGQLTYNPDPNFSLAALYGRSYYSGGTGVSGGTGSTAADNPFGGARTSANHYSFMASYKLTPNAVISGWAGFTNANREATGGGTADISNYALTLAFSDFGAEGNVLGFVFGLPPKMNSRSLPTGTTSTTALNPDTSYHLEALYKIKLNDSMDITPGLLLITNPENNSANQTIYVGTLRTTYRF